jgi:phenylpropionate dioxygenase-like ring-hydroxylating dioxygenase large terminal subunit
MDTGETPGKGAVMLATQQPILRRFWYAMAPITELAEGPRSVTLLGERLVLWLDNTGNPAALQDRCCHRTAQLSRGRVQNGTIQCGYHGWTFDRDGRCVRIPQARDSSRPIHFSVPSYRCAERYGYVWVCLGEPLADIPDIPEAVDLSFRQIHEFWETWQVPGLRVMENSFDNAHFSYVHAASFGIQDEPEPAPLTIEDEPWGFQMRSIVPVKNTDLQKSNLKDSGERTVRTLVKTWWMPFSRKMHVTYPNGLIHIIITCTAPIDDRSSVITQFVFRNDTEAEAPAADVIAFDRQVTQEDRAMLESTDYDVPLNIASREEFHMPSDRPGLEMRKRLLALLQAHGEHEARRTVPPLRLPTAVA